MTEKAKVVIKKEKTQEPEYINVKMQRVWDLKNLTEDDLGTLIEELVREVDVDVIMSHLLRKLAEYSEERKLFWARKIIAIKSKEEE